MPWPDGRLRKALYTRNLFLEFPHRPVSTDHHMHCFGFSVCVSKFFPFQRTFLLLDRMWTFTGFIELSDRIACSYLDGNGYTLVCGLLRSHSLWWCRGDETPQVQDLSWKQQKLLKRLYCRANFSLTWARL